MIQHSNCPRRTRIALALLALLLPAALAAQLPQLVEPPPADTAEAPADTAAPAFPGSYEVASRALAVADSAEGAERRVAPLADLGALGERVDANRAREAELREQLVAVADEGYLRPERISRLQDQALAEDARLEALLGDIAERLEELSEVRATWTERLEFWLAWRATLREDPDFPLLEPEFARAFARIEQVRERISTLVPTVLALQRETDSFRRQNQEILERTGDIRNRRREALLERDQPVLFSPAFVELLDDDLPAQIAAGVRATQPVGAAFLRTNLALILLQIAAILALALLTLRLRRRAGATEGWRRMLDHPWAIGVFVGLAVVGPQFGLTPPLWDLLLWITLAASGALLATGMFRNPRKRLLVYLVAGFYPVFLALQAISFPLPLFRIWLAGSAFAAMMMFWVIARRNERLAPEDNAFTWIVRIGAGVWGFVLGAEILGFAPLARWVVQSTISSAFAVFVVIFLVLLARTGLQALLSTEPSGRFRFIRRIGYPLTERLVWLLQVVLVVATALYILDVWEITPSPLQTWNAIIDAGFSIGSLEITVGRVLLAALAIYIAAVASWVIRVFLRGEVYGRWELDAGVGDSINTLLHYSLIVFGVLFAFSAIGFQLQNFAIVIGALGVGIGFGLQNIVNNFVSGLILLFERPVRVGDTVVVDGTWGSIKKIGLRSTVMVTFDQSEMIVPNGDLVSEKVTNWTLSNPVTRLVLAVGVAYGSDLEKVFGILKSVADGHDAVLAEPAPMALFMGFGDSSLDFELRVWVRHVIDRPVIQSALLTEIDRRFREADIEIPFPQRDLHLRSVAAEIESAVGRREAVGS